MVEKKVLWRTAAIVITLVWIIVFFAFSSFTSTIIHSDYSTFDNSIPHLVSIILSFMLIAYPHRFILYTLMCCIWGFLNLYDGGSTNGFLMYALGCAFAYKDNLLFKNKIITAILGVTLLIAVSTQYRFGVETIVMTIIDLIFILVVAFLSFALFNESFFTKFSNKEKAKIDLSVLNQTELEILQEVLANKTYYAIAAEMHKSESAVKQIMQKVCKKLKTKSKKELLELYEKDLLLISEQS